MEYANSQEKEDGIRLRRNLKEEHEEEEEVESSEDDVKTDLVKRIIESTKELTDCMPTDLPSAKRMVSTCANSCVLKRNLMCNLFLFFVTHSWKMDSMLQQSLVPIWLLELELWQNKLETFAAK